MADMGVSETAATLDAPGGLIHVRVAILWVAFVVIGATACDIFDRVEWVLVLAPTLPALSVSVLLQRPSLIRASVAFASAVISCAVAIIIVGGTVGDLPDALTSGFQGLLSTEWPSPTRPDLIGTVVFVLAAATALSVELAVRRRAHLLPLVPLLGSYVAVIALSAPLGAHWTSTVALGVLAASFALLRNSGALRDRLVLLRGERQLGPMLLMVALMAGGLTIPLSLTARADPRRNEPPAQTAPILDPIEATLALRDLDPAVDLHVVAPNDDNNVPRRWRTAALSDYDGDRWRPALTVRPIGPTLGDASGPTIAADVSFLDDDLSLVPLPGPPVSVDAEIETDAERTIVRLVERPEPGDRVSIVAEPSPAPDEVAPSGVASRVVGDDVANLTELAQALAGPGTAIDQLSGLASTMRNDFVLDNGVQGGGLQRAFIELFLRDTRRGNIEQFVTSYVLLARALGYDARVATGYVMANSEVGADRLVLSSADATIWPEVRLTDGRWTTFDPVPETEATDTAPPPPEPQTQTPAAPQPPIPPPPDPDNEAAPRDESVADEASGALSAVVTWAVRAAAGLAVLLLPFVVTAGLILITKRRRRRRRLTAGTVADRIRGAWANATDVLVDAGMSIGRSATDAQIAGRGEPLVADAARDLHRLAALSSAATYGSPDQPAFLADDAGRCLESVEGSLIAGRTRLQRMWWRLSVRSLRAATRSPVTG